MRRVRKRRGHTVRGQRRTLGLAAALTAVIAIGASGALAASDPYTPGTTGYDVSYPQCGGNLPTGAFGIVGVNAGRPFTTNPCLAHEYRAAPTSPAPSLYINTAYSGAFRKSITSGCASESRGVSGTSAQQQAWAIGCSEAESSLNYANQLGATSVSMWWLDVETGNSWSTNNLSLNRFAIQGAVTRLGQTGLPVGVYSTASMWNTITGGGFTPSGSSATWVALGTCGESFNSSPTWLVQYTSGGFDYDTAC